MGTGQSKNSPDEQMRMKMENGFDEDDEDIDTLGLPQRDKTTRSKSNLSFHTSERFKNADGEEYFNKIYNKKNEKSLTSLNNSGGGSIKSAPAGQKKEKDPEVAAAIAELEETFKVLGDSQSVSRGEKTIEKVGEPQQFGHYDELDNGYDDSLSIGVEELSSSPNHIDSTREPSDESGMDSQSESSPCQVQYDRHLISRAGETSHGLIHDSNGFPRRQSKYMELNNRAIGTSGGLRSNTYNGSGSSVSTIGSRGSEQRSLLSSSHANIINGRNSSNPLSKSVLMQHRKDLQRKQTTDQTFRQELHKLNGEFDDVRERQEDWNYEPPKIDGFDIEKFKEINSNGPPSTILPISLREEEDNGYCSRSPEIPAYTKDELALIASLEREVY